MHLSIYSLKKVLFEGEASSVNCQTEAGEITVLDRHAPLITVLAPGTIAVVDASRANHYVNGGGGFLEVGSGNHVKLIIHPAPRESNGCESAEG